MAIKLQIDVLGCAHRSRIDRRHPEGNRLAAYQGITDFSFIETTCDPVQAIRDVI